jgi:hypothetical protein
LNPHLVAHRRAARQAGTPDVHDFFSTLSLKAGSVRIFIDDRQPHGELRKPGWCDAKVDHP